MQSSSLKTKKIKVGIPEKKVSPKETNKPIPKKLPNLFINKTPNKTSKTKASVQSLPIRKILFTLPKPDGTKSPYYDLISKYSVELDFYNFIRVEGVDKQEFRNQRINILNYSAIIFTSRNAIDHFFKLVNDLKIKISTEIKYFCMSESVALYLQKFIVYKKRKVFFAEEHDVQKWHNLLDKHHNEKFLFPYSNIEYKDFIHCLQTKNIDYTLAYIYKVVSNDIKDIILKNQYDIMCFFTQGGIKSLFDNFPQFQTTNTMICVFGNNTFKLAESYGLNITLKIPSEKYKSVYDALEDLLSKRNKHAKNTH